MYDTILVPVDGSEPALDAIAHAASLATLHDAALALVHVIEPQAAVESAGVEIVSALEQAGEQALADAEKAATDAGVADVDIELLNGLPHQEIIEYAETADVDLIVMATHGRTGLGRLLLGSVSEKVVRTSPVPVTTIRPSESSV